MCAERAAEQSREGEQGHTIRRDARRRAIAAKAPSVDEAWTVSPCESGASELKPDPPCASVSVAAVCDGNATETRAPAIGRPVAATASVPRTAPVVPASAGDAAQYRAVQYPSLRRSGSTAFVTSHVSGRLGSTTCVASASAYAIVKTAVNPANIRTPESHSFCQYGIESSAIASAVRTNCSGPRNDGSHSGPCGSAATLPITRYRNTAAKYATTAIATVRTILVNQNGRVSYKPTDARRGERRATTRPFAGGRSDSGEAVAMLSRTHPARAAALPGIVAGLVGGVVVDAYLLLTVVFIMHAAGVVPFYQFVASGALGKAAYGDPNAAYLGVAMHFVVSAAWGVGYAYVAERTPQVRDRPLISGVAFGIVVMLAMQLVEVAANVYTLPNSFTLLNDIVAHTLFFGVPVAYIVRARLR